MACVENIPPPNADSEMEEGEIVDDLSDISSEEEFLLRQRLQVLENYNNVLERKKAKRSSIEPGSKHKKEDALLYLSEISATELEDYYSHAPHKSIKVQKRQKSHHRQKRKREEPVVNLTKKDRKKNHVKKKVALKIISESSEESEDEYRNRRRKLANAVVVNKDFNKNDKTSLSERLQKMLCGVNPEPTKLKHGENKTDSSLNSKKELSELSPISSVNADDNSILNSETPENMIQEKTNLCELIDLCTDEDSKTVTTNLHQDTVDSVSKSNVNEDGSKTYIENISDKDSDEDLEKLRQHALKTKTIKAKVVQQDQSENKISEDEDSDTAELRLICLKSALLKKAIEMKQKQKLKKRRSQSSNLPDEFLNSDNNNNTDIESVDMDIGSDGDEKAKENPEGYAKSDGVEKHTITDITKTLKKDIPILNIPNEDELEDDEDLLRAKLLTSLSKNLPNLVNPNVIDTIERIKDTRPISPKPAAPKPVVPSVVALGVVPEEKRFIINLGESDSEGEHEATKNLTKMHMKLSEQIDFQQRLDMFLKSTRLEVEKTNHPDTLQQSAPPKKNEKFVAKAVKHLPKSEQIEYRNLVKRMAELEKMKQARQSTINLSHKVLGPVKDTLKPRNATIDASKLSVINSLEEKIKTSRKHIAEESAKMLKLKEEGMKLSQKYKIVATELRNIKTAITLNKKQTRSVQNCLNKIRLHHQMLLKSSMTSSHSKINGNMPPITPIVPRLQKENNPMESKNPILIKNPKVIVKEIHPVTEENKNPLIHKPIKVIIKDKETHPTQGIITENNPTKVVVTESNPTQVIVTEKNPTKVIVNESNPAKVIVMESNPTKKEYGDILVHFVNQKSQKPLVQKLAKVAKEPPLVIQHPKLSIKLDVTNNKKVVEMSDDKTDANDKTKLNVEQKDNNGHLLENKRVLSHPVVEKGGGAKVMAAAEHKIFKDDDYRSPLDAFGSTTWEEDPNAILCPFEVGGDCKDSDCKYLHTKFRSK